MNQESRIKNQERLMIPSRGFTLIELTVVFAVIGILGAIAITAFFDYSRTLKLQTAANDLTLTLNVAKQNSLSQLKDHPSCTVAVVLNGYKVRINNSTTYDLDVVCGGADFNISTKSLPANITFSSPTPASFFFPVLKGGVTITGSPTITLTGFGKTKSVTVTNAGVIK
jgi:prepilin-type N-terminal cleavage/methylation domain-containing protein